MSAALHVWLLIAGWALTCLLLVATAMWLWQRIRDNQWIRLQPIKDDLRSRFVFRFNRRPWPHGVSIHVPPFKRYLFVRMESTKRWERSEHHSTWLEQRRAQSPSYQAVMREARAASSIPQETGDPT